MSHSLQGRTRWRANAVGGFAALASLMTLGGCDSVSAAGATGISVDAQAQPVLVFALCNDHIDGATIFRVRTQADPKEDDASVSVASWDAASPLTPKTATQISLNTIEPSGTWPRSGPSEALRPGVVYTAYGWTRDSAWYTRHVDFTLERLSRLKPGQVLTQTYVPAKNHDVDTVQSDDQFRAIACEGTGHDG